MESSPPTIGLGVFELNDEGARLLFINSALISLLRLPAVPNDDQALVDVLPGDGYAPIREALLRVRATAQPDALIWAAPPDHEAEAGSRVSFEVYPVFTAPGRARYELAVARPADARAANLEVEVIHLRKQAGHLAETERAKSEFMTLASHELRGPLSLLRGYVAMLKDGSLGVLPPAAVRILPILEARVRQLNDLAGEMTEIGRLEGAQPRTQPTRVDLGAIVVRVIAGFEPAAPNHHIVLDGRAPPLQVSADPHRVEIIVTNLVDNAIKYSPNGGEIFCRLSTSGSLGFLVVSDHGIGIAAEDMPRLFTRFARFAATERSDIPGTGLGLYLSRELARLDGGDMTAVSQQHVGSEFTLSLPTFSPR